MTGSAWSIGSSLGDGLPGRVVEIVPRRTISAERESPWWGLLYVFCFHAGGVADFMWRLCLLPRMGIRYMAAGAGC